MGVYRRKDSPSLWLVFRNEAGTRTHMSAETTDAKVAAEKLKTIEALVASKKALGIVDVGPVTVEKWSRRWLEDRRKKRLATVNDDEDRLAHVMPALGRLPLAEVRPRHIADAIAKLVEKDELSPRTIHHVYGALRVMFRAAQKKELILATPCILSVRDGDLPKKRDADPKWRKTAVFSKEEVELLIGSPLVPEVRRVLWALLFLGSMRIGEAADRRWSQIDESAQPLPKLIVDSAYVTKRREVKAGGKTGIVREVPIHPTLTLILNRWLSRGWHLWVAHAKTATTPKPCEDLIVPGPRGGHLSSITSLEWLHKDLKKLGLRQRRQHDGRRTFVSLLRGDGGRPDIVDLIAWGKEPGVRGDYTSIPYPALCAEVTKLNLRLPSEPPVTPSYAVSQRSETT